MWTSLLVAVALFYLWKIDRDVETIRARVSDLDDKIESLTSDVTDAQRSLVTVEDEIRRIRKEVCPPSPIPIDF